MKVVVGHSADPLTLSALEEILDQCREQLGDEQPQAGILYACISADHEQLLSGITGAFPGLELIGCSTDGELSSQLAFQEDSIVLMLFVARGVSIRAGLGRQLSADPEAAAREAILSARQAGDPEPRLCITLPESLQVSGVSVVTALNGALGGSVPLVGATAGDQWQFQGTRQFFRNEVLQDGLPVLLFSGDLRMGVGVCSGWTPCTVRSRVTRAEGNVVHEIDGIPATQYYWRYFGNHISLSPEYPLGVYAQGSEAFYLRAPMAADLVQGTITFAGDVPEGAEVRVTEGSREHMLQACESSVQSALEGLDGARPAAALVFSCAARKQLLGTRTAEEYEVLSRQLGPETPVIGFYSYGEIAPLGGQPQADFHNETFVTVLLGAA